MDIFGFLSLIGGLALFLYGMNVMGGGLEKLSGGKLERILENLTSNPFKAVLLGAGVTAVCLYCLSPAVRCCCLPSDRHTGSNRRSGRFLR